MSKDKDRVFSKETLAAADDALAEALQEDVELDRARQAEEWLDGLEAGEYSELQVRDPKLLRAIGQAKTDLDRVRDVHEAVPGSAAMQDAEDNLVQAISKALLGGETWAGIGRTIGVARKPAELIFAPKVAQMRVAQEKLLAAVEAAKPVDLSEVREGGYITVENKFDAKYEDRVLRVAMGPDGQLERVLLAGPPNYWISFSNAADWQVTGYKPPVYRKGWVGWATIETEQDTTTRLFGMWVNMRLGHEDRLYFATSDTGQFYAPRDVRGFDKVELLYPGPLDDFKVDGAKLLYEFGSDAQGFKEDERTDWDRITGKQFYFDKMGELIQLLKNKLS